MKKLNFGCGNDIREGWINVDIQKGKGVDYSFDFDSIPYPFKDDTFDYIFLDNVLEHLLYPDRILHELRRITKKGGKIEVIVPHYTNKGAYNEMQHLHFFNEECFKKMEESKRVISKDKKFRILSLEVTPTSVGKFIPLILRKKISLFINGLNSQIRVVYEVLK